MASIIIEVRELPRRHIRFMRENPCATESQPLPASTLSIEISNHGAVEIEQDEIDSLIKFLQEAKESIDYGA